MQLLRVMLVLVCLVGQVAYAEVPDNPRTRPEHKHEFSVGFLSHKVGASLVSYARTLWSTEHHELYAGAGH